MGLVVIEAASTVGLPLISRGPSIPNSRRDCGLKQFRGCVRRCAYCYYHKQSPGLRAFPLSRVLGEIGRAWDRELREIVFLDPCFVRRPNIRDFIDAIAAVNRDRRLKFHAESTVEGIDGPLAERMARAGFVKIEAGLQSTRSKNVKADSQGLPASTVP